MNALSIRRKLLLITTISCAVALAIFAFAFASSDRAAFRTQTVHTLEIQAQIVGANCSVPLTFGDQVVGTDTLQALRVDRQIELAAIYDNRGRIFASYQHRPTSPKPPPTLALIERRENSEILQVIEPIHLKKDNVGTIYVVANLDELEKRQGNLFTMMMMLAAGSLAAVILIAGRLQRLISEPIGKLLNAMSHVSEKKDYSVRLMVSGKDEINQLVVGFNEMLGEIESRDHELENRVAARTEALSAEIEVRRKTETELEHALGEAKDLAEAAQAASQTKSQFLANMSHEIRTPMNGVIGLTSILLDTPLNDEQIDLTRTIKFSGESLLSIINDILDFSKAEAGKFQIQPEHFSLDVLIEEVGDLMAQGAEAKGLELICSCDPAIPAVLNADYGRLRQVIINLLSNAIKFTAEGEVLLKAILIAKRGGIASIEISVTDSGIGIPPEQQEKIFESFTQADGTSTRRHGGTGLGLTICRQIVSLMGGYIRIESQPGVGSTFICTLPIEIVQDNSESSQILSGCRVLLVDDSATSRNSLSEVLGQFGSQNDSVASGKEAISMLASTPPNFYSAVILDIKMPDMSGTDTALQIRKLPGHGALPIVFMSSLGTTRLPEELQSEGTATAVSKPVRPSRLLSALLSALGRTAPTESAPCLAEETPTDKPLVLLVEDNAVNRKVAQRVLDKLGYEVDIAVDGTEAVPMANARHYDLILMDIQMPRMDGYAATSLIRDLPGDVGKNVPIIAMTANAMSGDREQCLAARMDDYISKPFTREQLSAVLDRWQSKAA